MGKLLSCLLAAYCFFAASVAYSQDADAKSVFEKRLMPIFKSPNPSSCVQCHLAGVDLKDYIRPSHEQTFVSLRDQSLIDLQQPEKSKILQLISMGEKNAGAALIHQKNRTAEYDAFAAWIKASAADPKLRDLPKAAEDERSGPKRPLEVVRHARKDRILESFENNIWAMRFRCMSCHIEGTDENRKLVAKHGKKVAWFKKEGPEAALDFIVASGLIDIDQPEKSLLLTKPLNDVEHGGGKKFVRGDQGHRAFLEFVQDYSRIKKDAYPDAASLPKVADRRQQFGSESWLKIANTPAEWGDRLLQVDLHAWNAKTESWDDAPIATSDRTVWGKGKLWQHTLTLSADKGSDLAKRWSAGPAVLPEGRYLAKAYLVADAVAPPGAFVGQVEVRSAWPTGYGRMTVLEGGRFRR
ncbi:MAG: hypothetical protein U0744_08435 [Gemmataceae bacterium]